MLITDLFESTQPQPLDEGVNDPGIFKAVFMAGPPGAGKNVVVQQLGLAAAGLKLQDIDKTKYYLQKMRGTADYDQSLRATQGRQAQYTQNMLGLTINTTGRDSSRVIQLKRELEAAGYDTFMVFVEVDYGIALDRIADRETSATDPSDRRPVDRDYFDQAFDDCTENASYYALMFGNQFAYVTNNVTKEEEVLGEDEYATGAREEFAATMKLAAKKVDRFLKKPLTAKAQQQISAITNRPRRG